MYLDGKISAGFEATAFDCHARTEGKYRTGGKNDDFRDPTVQGFGSCWIGRLAACSPIAEDLGGSTNLRSLLFLAV